MPRKKKHPKDMTTDEAMEHLFPKPVVKHARKLAGKEPDPEPEPPKRSIRKDRT